MFDYEYIISLYFNGDEALTEADVDHLSEWIEQSQENAAIFLQESFMHRAIHDALVSAEINRNVLLDLQEGTGSDYEAVMDSNVSLEGVSIDEVLSDEKEKSTAANVSEISRSLMGAFLELAECERTAPSIEIPKEENPRELIQKVV